MLIDPVTIESVRHIEEIDHERALKNHFQLMFRSLAESKLVKEAHSVEVEKGVFRYLTGISLAFNNCLIGTPSEESDAVIDEQIRLFKEAKLPFVWYLDEDSSPSFKQKLLDHGFAYGGLFRGVVGPLDSSLLKPEKIAGFTLKEVKDYQTLELFNDVVCTTFGIEGISKELFLEALFKAQLNNEHPMHHFIALKETQPVAAVSILLDSEMASFWNGATLPEFRRYGLSTELRKLALLQALQKGSRLGASYLMKEGMALGICSRLGYETKWRFDVFIAPPCVQ